MLMIQERAVKSLMSFFFNSFWDIYVQTSPQISMCKKTVQKWVDGPFSKKYILKSILYMKPLDNNIVIQMGDSQTEGSCLFKMEWLKCHCKLGFSHRQPPIT